MLISDAHYQWAARPESERFGTLDEMHAAAERFKQDSRESEMTPLRQLAIVPQESDITLDSGQRFTNWSMGQLASTVGAPRDFLARLTPDTAARALNEQLAKSDAECSLLLTSGTVRALNGSRYTRLWSADLTRTLLDMLPPGWRNPVAYRNGEWGAPLEPSGLYLSDRDMFAFFIDGGDMLEFDAGSGGTRKLHRGFFVKNSEVGARGFELTSFVFDMVCGNNYVWGAQDVSITRLRHTKHIAKANDVLELFLFKVAKSQGDPRIVLTDAARAAAKQALVPVTADAEELETAFKPLGFTKSEALRAQEACKLELDSPRGTRWDWYLGMTGAARALKHSDEREALEVKAQVLLK